jgi:hypothetical protein
LLSGQHSKNCAAAHITFAGGSSLIGLSDAMHLADFDFDLPRELIANRPLEPREAAAGFARGRRAGGPAYRRFALSAAPGRSLRRRSTQSEP